MILPGSPKPLAMQRGGALNVADVFSIDLLIGSRFVINGLDFASNAGLAWNKWRGSTADHLLIDTIRGIGREVSSNLNEPETTYGIMQTFNTDGVTYKFNETNSVVWSFLASSRFFDILTYTGDGVAGRKLPHNLGGAPGMITIKPRNGFGGFSVYHRSAPLSGANLILSSTNNGGPNQYSFGDGVSLVHPSSTDFTVGANNNGAGVQYVAYSFAHDPEPDGIIQCGSYVGNGSTTGPIVTLGWPPQYLLIKRIDLSGVNWLIVDYLRSNFGVALFPNNANAEFAIPGISVTAAGFKVDNTQPALNASGGQYIYMAIRAEGT